ncbi:Conserved_hypothetical protein [Hexamita inflata]|uniref:Uncharacterized protein n=1 Tax=Hexamita inflata TaxID=28002 RepID=A0AA86PZ08_9EUKA|nr:Conserved hypothetical protein [Hexamita inflata]CAI9949035.1 Conserved hypothetical protein [Hexamita inflata]
MSNSLILYEDVTIHSFQASFQISSKKFNINHFLDPNIEYNQIALSNDSIYFLFDQDLYQINSQAQVIQLCTVPFSTVMFIPFQQLFSLNNNLYFANESNLFVYNNLKFKFCKFIKGKYVKIIDRVFIVNFQLLSGLKHQNTIVELKEDLMIDYLEGLNFTRQVIQFEVINDCVVARDAENNQVTYIIDLIEDKYKICQESINYSCDQSYQEIYDLNRDNTDINTDKINLFTQKMLLRHYSSEKYQSLVKSLLEQHNVEINFPTPFSTQHNEILHQAQLINVVKLLPDANIYITIEDNFIYVVDNNQVILDKIAVDFDFYCGRPNINNPSGPPAVFSYRLYQPVICKGEIYVLVFDSLYKLFDLKMQFVAKIPNFSQRNNSALVNRFFSYNDKIYAHDFNFDQSTLYYLEGFEFVKCKDFNTSFDIHFINFCNLVNIWYQESDILKLDNELNTTSICEINVDDLIYVNAKGILIAFTSDFKSIKILNLLDQTVSVIPNSIYCNNQILNSPLVLGRCGLQLNEKLLQQLVGCEFISKQRQVFEEYINNQILTNQEYQYQIEQILHHNFEVLFITRCQQFKNRLAQLSRIQSIGMYCSQINVKFKTVLLQLEVQSGIITNKFVNIITQSSTQ